MRCKHPIYSYPNVQVQLSFCTYFLLYPFVITLQDRRHKGEIQACTFSSSDGKQILCASSDNTLKVWDTESGKLLGSLEGHLGPVQSCDFSPDGKWIASGSWDRTIKLWDTRTYSIVETMQGHSDWVQQVMFSPPDGNQIISRSLDHSVKIWDTENGLLLETLLHEGLIETFAISRTGDTIVCGYSDKLKVWHLDTQTNLTMLGHKGAVLCSAFSRDSSKFISGSADNTLKRWDLSEGKVLTQFAGHSGWVLSCTLSPDGDQVLSGSNDTFVKLWDADTGRELGEYWAGQPVHSVAWHPSGELIAAGDSAGRVHLLSIRSLKNI